MKNANFAVDIGMTNIDIILETGDELVMQMLENQHQHAIDQLIQAFDMVKENLQPGMVVGVTGGRYRDLPNQVAGFQIKKVNEMWALGLGGLALSGLDSGLVVSGGTGTAMVAAVGSDVKHVTGSAVGGGTLLGLSKLILGTTDIKEIDALALAGDAAAVDIMLSEAVGGGVGRLPANANAVNLGKLDRQDGFTLENLAAGLVRLVAQVIAVIAINAANAESLDAIVMVGHLMDLESIRDEIDMVGEFYQRKFIVPDDPGFGTAMGVLQVLRQESN
ncbi:MAG: Fumble domain-containing protein [Chloroflexota bacterium]|nr:Fumble domain-containing protein [Chloroflexota bacterium]